MNRYAMRIMLLSVATLGCLASRAHAVVVVAEDFLYEEETKGITDLGGFGGRSYGGGQNGSGGVWDDRWAAIGGATIVGDDVLDPPLSANAHTAVVTEFASAVSLQRSYVPRGAAATASTIYFAGDFKIDETFIPSIFAEFGILSPAATLDAPAVSIGITDSEETIVPTFFAQLGGTTVTGNASTDPDDALVDATSHRIVGKLQLNAAPAVGDYNGNGLVDAADYSVWRDKKGGASALANRDPANTGNVSDADYNSWVSRFGQSGEDRLTVYFNPTGVEQSNATILTVNAEVAAGFSDGALANVASLNGDPAGESSRPHYIDNLAIGTTWADVAAVNVPRLTLQLDTGNGQASLVNNSSQSIDLAYYEIVSASNSLTTSGWLSLDEQNVSGGAWLENSPSTGQLTESNLLGATTIASGGGTLSLGAPFAVGGTQDLVVRWGTKEGSEGLLNVAIIVPVAAGSGSAVPEPAAYCLLIVGVVAVLCARSRASACR